MKNYFKRVAVAMLLLAMANVCAARQWHVNNLLGIKADFSSIDAAMSSADVVDGDTIYIGAGCVLGSQTISKKVTVIGTGWGYADSPATVAKINGDVTIKANGAVVVGLYVSGKCYLQANNITVQRCRFISYIEVNTGTIINSVRILSCYTGGIVGASTSYKGNGWEIKNNIIDGSEGGSVMAYLYNATIENNIIRNTYGNTNYTSAILYYCDYCVVKNNILISHAWKDASCFNNSGYNSITHNVMSMSSGFNDTNTMLGSTELSNIFKCTGSKESGEYFSLKEDSPAIGAGEGGVDCGVMAGAYSFVPFGRPDNIPVIKKFVAPDSTTGGEINVTIGF